MSAGILHLDTATLWGHPYPGGEAYWTMPLPTSVDPANFVLEVRMRASYPDSLRSGGYGLLGADIAVVTDDYATGLSLMPRQVTFWGSTSGSSLGEIYASVDGSVFHTYKVAVLNGALTASVDGVVVATGTPNANTAGATPSIVLGAVSTSGGNVTADVDWVRLSSPYTFTGFFSPVDNSDANGDPILNTVKAGQAIPLKWRVTDINAEPVADLTTATVTVSGLACSLGTTTDQVEEVASGGSGLQNLGDGYYQFNWKSPKSYAGSCKLLRLSLLDGGITQTAQFQFTK